MGSSLPPDLTNIFMDFDDILAAFYNEQDSLNFLFLFK